MEGPLLWCLTKDAFHVPCHTTGVRLVYMAVCPKGTWNVYMWQAQQHDGSWLHSLSLSLSVGCSSHSAAAYIWPLRGARGITLCICCFLPMFDGFSFGDSACYKDVTAITRYVSVKLCHSTWCMAKYSAWASSVRSVHCGTLINTRMRCAVLLAYAWSYYILQQYVAM